MLQINSGRSESREYTFKAISYLHIRMRDSNHRSVLANRPVVTISSTVYDRRALDINSNIPLINSLNHLTYLTSNSEKVRETLASDGALERLVSILHGCYIPLFQLLGHDSKHISKHKHAQVISKQKKLAMCAWKWTLAFQCLVLTGTRGTEQIRKKVVMSGVIPLLATVLDNYLIYHKNYDHFTGSSLDTDISSLESKKTYLKLRKDADETYEEYMEYITGREPLRLSEDENFLCEELLRPSMTLPSDYVDIWSSSKCAHSRKECNSKGHHRHAVDGSLHIHRQDNNVDEEVVDKDHIDDGSFQLDDDEDHKLSISIPREFFLGRIVPKQDDVIWSLQLLAFISKYTYMKQQLQNVELIESLSFRAILERVRKRKCHYADLTNDGHSGAQDIIMTDACCGTAEEEAKEDPFLLELQSLVNSCKKLAKDAQIDSQLPVQNPYENLNLDVPLGDHNSRIEQEKHLVKNFEEKWDYNSLSTDLDEETWAYVNSKHTLNLFPLVERCTVNNENPHDMVYWSSVIMRNSCRKNEVTGVRQCANFECGVWEDYPRQFAKCRRCKRTKYCSRGCQLKAWTYHRFWCHEGASSVESSSSNTGDNTPGMNQNSAVSAAVNRTHHGTIPLVNSLESDIDGNDRDPRIVENMGVNIGAGANETEINIARTVDSGSIDTNTVNMGIVDSQDVTNESEQIDQNDVDDSN